MHITEVFSVDDEEVVDSEEIVQAAKTATKSLLPSKSRDKYEKEYRNFMDWSQTKKITGKCSEDVAYFLEKSENIQQLLSGQLLAGGKNFYSPRPIIY
ncbi:hypothetical protein MTP99_001828 [Tenebrio molitor]|jgi:hypothetical protein|nr:hypothetical protein MTP99_001828 [Tenebrio molitor]